MKSASLWFITPKTNLHVGNENTTSYDLIDKAVQRDALTNLPCINSSSLKGALNEYATEELTLSSEELVKIFGCNKKDSKVGTQKGDHLFFDANILFLPKQDNMTLYKLVTCEKVISMFVEKCNNFGCGMTRDELMTVFQCNETENIVSNEVFEKLCHDYNLPIIARNRVGENNNLWYEQVVPSETIFYTFIGNGGDVTLTDKINAKIVQIGANATIGYGYCQFKSR